MRALLMVAAVAGLVAAQETKDDGKRYGRFLTRGEKVFFETDSGKILPLANPEGVKANLAMIPTGIRGTVDERGFLTVTDVMGGKVLSRWSARPLSPEMKVDPILERSLAQLEAAHRLARRGRGKANRAIYAGALRKVETDVAGALRKNSDSKFYLELATATIDELKAIYAREDLYFPHVYLAMYASSRSCVLIQHRSGAARGSGVLVAPDLVLTCRHCTFEDAQETNRYAPTDLRVVWGYEKGPDGGSLDDSVYAVKKYVVTGKNVDYCLLRITKGPKDLPSPEFTRKLSTSKVSLDRAIYVIGHPEGKPRTISDDATVLFPFEADDVLLSRLWLRLRVQCENSGGLAEQLIREVENNYKLGRDGTHRYLRKSHKNHPTIGADCDTFSGNSGSGVYTKDTHDLIGILYAGQVDKTEAYRPGWRRHERIAPAVAILQDLRDQEVDPKQLGIVPADD